MEILGILSGVATGIVLYKLLFDGWDDFVECVKFSLTPDLLSLFRGQFWDDHWSTLKLSIWLAAIIGVGLGVSRL